jgi:hypothetical protein
MARARSRAALLPTLALFWLTGCGGEDAGGGGNPPAPPPPAPPAPTFTVGGNANGLGGTGLVLQNNGGDDLAVAANGSFTFARSLATGLAYDVRISTQPTSPDQVCTVASGSGNVASSNVTTVSVSCATPPPAAFTIGGTVTGLNGTVVLQGGGGATLAITTDGAFTFPGTVNSGGNYDVSVLTQPLSPPQVCSVTNGTGVVSSANITNISVECHEFLTVTATTPSNSSAGVARDAAITVQFSARIDAATVNTANISLSSVMGSTPITVSVADDIVTIRPASRLLPLGRYTLTLSREVRGTARQRLAGIVTLVFTTRDGAWGTPRMLPTGDVPIGAGSLGVDARGNAIATGTSFTGGGWQVWTSRYLPASGWSTAATLATLPNNLTYLQLAVGANGTAILLWSEHQPNNTVVLAAHFDPDTDWGPEFLLSGANASGASGVAMAPNGDAMAVWEEWTDAGNSVWGRRYVAGSGWGAGQQLNSSSGPSAAGSGMAPFVAMDRDGNALVTYRRQAGIFFDLWAHRFEPGAGWIAPSPIETEESSANIGPPAFDRFGNAIVVWTQGTANFGHSSIWANRYERSSGWGTATLLENDTVAPGFIGSPVAFDGEGNAIAVWQHTDLSRTATDIWSNRYVTGLGWGQAELIETQRQRDANNAQVVMDASGHGIAMWSEHDGTAYRVRTNRYIRGAGWGIAVRLDPTSAAPTYAPQLVMDELGNAMAMWGQVDAVSGATRLYTARFE